VVRRSRRHRGRASLRKREKPTPGSLGTDDERLAACHRFRKGAAWYVRKGRRSWPPSPRGSTSSGLFELARRTQLQKSSSNDGSRISSANALQKERLRRVNRGLARSGGRRVTPSAGASSERVVVSRTPPGTGEDRLKAQSDGRLSFSGGTIAKSGEVVAGPGL
jgi:hypothetical protein